MAGNQHRGAIPLSNPNVEAGEEEEPRTMGYYMAPQAADIQSPILHPPVAANNFEIKPSLVTMIQQNAYFHRLAHESPREHVRRFHDLAGSLKINGIPEEAFLLKLFPYSLVGKALRWLNNRPPLSITSWDDLLITSYLHMFAPSFLDHFGLSFYLLGLFYARLCSFVTFQVLACKLKHRRKFQVNQRSFGNSGEETRA
ncbi:unnamed protein product [Linum trigynum]|uniref:Retrotransposon gag domain-containing protein n=1 Tax=Linum trigynum TaxID=586398 RepID=A0AAV2FZ25_9ROSI